MKAKINGVEIAYTDQGKGTPVLLVHGYPFNRSMWDAQVKALSTKHRAIAVDLRGHGESQAPTGTYTMDHLADDLKGLLDHLGIGQVVLVGFSMGGYVAFAFYRKYPQWVKALVLADTRTPADTEQAKQGRENTAQTALKEGVTGIAQNTAPRMVAPSTAQSNPALMEKVLGIMRSTSVNGYVGDLRGMAERPDSTATLAKIVCPTLILVGDQDGVTPPADSKAMSEAIRSSRLVTIPGAGHLTPLEQPAAVNKAMLDFLGTL